MNLLPPRTPPNNRSLSGLPVASPGQSLYYPYGQPAIDPRLLTESISSPDTVGTASSPCKPSSMSPIPHSSPSKPSTASHSATKTAQKRKNRAKRIVQAKQAGVKPCQTTGQSAQKDKVPCDDFESGEPSSDEGKTIATQPDFGMVQNAFTGGTTWTNLPRAKPLPPAADNYSRSQHRYRRLMPELIRRVERVSHETGCWLYLILDHPGATKPVTSFYSPRLRKDGGKAVTDAHKQMCVTFAGLKRALKHSNADMATQLQEKEADIEAKNAHIRELEAKLLETSQ